jgi:ABC-type Zn2+ transport system substrate-binding protein/surface adhesin
MAAGDVNRQLLDALATHAAASLGPIATLIVEQAAATGGGFEDIRRKVAAQMDSAAAKAFVAATDPLAAKAVAVARTVGAPSVPPAAATPESSRTLDLSDPGLVQAVGLELMARVGPRGQTLVQEAARKCRTTVQFYLRLAAQVDDLDLKVQLSQRAAAEAASRSAPRA